MSILSPHTLAERIIAELKKGNQCGPALMEALDRGNQHYTKQALYAALRQLIREEVVVRARGTYALSTSWIRDLQIFAQEAGHQYGTGTAGSEALSLAEKESVAYTFANTHTLDAFWGHVQNLLVAHTPQMEPICAFDPHYWFLVARRETESKLLKEFVRGKRQFLMAISGDTELDRHIKQEFDGTYTQYAHAPLFNRPGYYVTALGEYVIEVLLDPKLESTIQAIYKKCRTTSEAESELRALLPIRAKNKIKISRNYRKAQKIKSKFKKYFFIKS